MVDRARMLEQLILHEGLKLEHYKDTEGYTTIGIGYNVSARGYGPLIAMIGRKFGPDDKLTRDEAVKACESDIDRVEKSVQLYFPTYKDLDEVRQRVCVDMAYNMGFKALGFKETIKAAVVRNWSRASIELYKSKWAYQVGDGPGGRLDRCDRLSQMLLTGKDWTK